MEAISKERVMQLMEEATEAANKYSDKQGWGYSFVNGALWMLQRLQGDEKARIYSDSAQLLRKETGSPLSECIRIIATTPTGSVEDWKEDLRRFGRKF